jgi:Holliday junction resolvasome RuvABC endonuclease subunit
MRVVKMMKHKDPVPAVIMAVDASSTAIAISIFDQKKDKTFLKEVGKLKLERMPMNMKLKIITSFFKEFFHKYKIDYVFVEQPIYIQNPATSRVLSQVSGHVIGTCLNYCDNVSEVTIANWKSFIGYKNVSKAEKESWTRQFGEKESKKMAASERKQRTIRIVHEKISGIDHINDNDICDSIGIGLYSLDLINKEDYDGT